MNAENHEQKPRRRRRPGDFAVVRFVAHTGDETQPLIAVATGLTTLKQAREWVETLGEDATTYRVIRFVGQSLTVAVKQLRTLKVS